jgi:O-antigen/teichoic acid export membrane protein
MTAATTHVATPDSFGSEPKHPLGRALFRLRGVRSRLTLGRGGLSGAQVLAVRLAGAVLAYAAQVIAARYLGQDGFGIYALALVWLTILGHLSTLGTNQSITRYVAQALATGDEAAVRGFVRFGIVFVIGAGGLIGGVGVAVLTIAPGLVDSAYLWPLFLAALAVPLIGLQDNLESIARAFDRPILGIAPAYLVRHGAAIALFGGLALSGVAGTPTLAVAAALAAVGIGIAIQGVLLIAAIRRRVPPGPRRYEIRRWLATALPVAFVDGIEILMLNADVLLVGLFQPPHMVAAYFAATRLTQILDYARYAMSAANAQRFAAYAATDRMADLRRLAALTTVATVALTAFGAIVVIAAAEPLLALFGPDFTVAAGIVPILAAGMVVGTVFGPGEDVLTMLGEERSCAAVFAGALVLCLILNVSLIPTFGLAGAALATALTIVARSAALALVAWWRLGIALPLGLSFASTRGTP